MLIQRARYPIFPHPYLTSVSSPQICACRFVVLVDEGIGFSLLLSSYSRYARQTFWFTIVASITVDRSKTTVLHSRANRSSTHRRRKLLRKIRFRYARCIDDAPRLSLDPARSRVHRKANAATVKSPSNTYSAPCRPKIDAEMSQHQRMPTERHSATYQNSCYTLVV